MNWSERKTHGKTALSLTTNPISWFSTSNSRSVAYGVIVVILFVRLLFITSPSELFIANMNRLILGEAAPPGVVSVDVAPLTDLPPQISLLLDLRRQRVSWLSKYMPQSYQPSQTVFSRIKDTAPWMTSQQFFGRGASTVVETAGPKFEARGLLNPLLLVEPVFFEPSGQGAAQEAGVAIPSATDPFQPELSSMTFDPARNQLRYTFLLSSFMDATSRSDESGIFGPVAFSISLYNARDLGFDTWTFDEQASQGVTAPRAGEYRIIDHLRVRTDLCPTATGCNHRSLLPPQQIGFSVSAAPAEAVFKLTKKSKEGAPEIFMSCLVSFL